MTLRKRAKSYEYSSDAVRNSVLSHARSIKMAPGWAKQIADRVAKHTDEWIADKQLITEDDLRREIIKALEPLSSDLAYAYKNHDKII